MSISTKFFDNFFHNMDKKFITCLLTLLIFLSVSNCYSIKEISLEEFKKLFTEAATKQFGSGWAWLLVKDGKLEKEEYYISIAPQQSFADIVNKLQAFSDEKTPNHLKKINKSSFFKVFSLKALHRIFNFPFSKAFCHSSKP